MKKWGLFLIVVCIGIIFIMTKPFSEPKVKIQNHNQHIGKAHGERASKQIEIAENQAYQGDLLLINSTYPVQEESIKKDIVNLSANGKLINGYGVFGENVYLSEEIAHRFSEMMTAASKDGVNNFSITSGFRDFDQQSELYEEMGSDFALPAGYSEHNTGLSLDVGSTQTRMADAPEGKWLQQNAWKYGFILRYPKDKTEITGIQYEPWHIRYVGLPHSAIMKEKNLALEEYTDYIREEKSISARVGGNQYEIYYYPIAENTEIQVPADLHYDLSGNNIDGVVVTVSLDQPAET